MNNIPLATREAAKAVKFNRVAFIVRLDKKAVYVLFPDFEEYIEIPILDESIRRIEEMVRRAEYERASLGDTVLDEHSCAKVRVTSKQFKTDQATVWNANDMNGFPLRIEMPSLNIHFTNIKLAQPDVQLFEIPTNYV